MKIHFVRHGESEANVAGVINDDPARPVGLTTLGRAQAEAASERLHLIPYTHAFASEFPRAQQTAEILLRRHDCPLQVDARLNERRSGMDGLPVELFNDLVRGDPLHTKPVEGESFLEQMERLCSFMDEQASRHPDGVVLAVSHENPILAALALSSGNPEQFVSQKLANCQCVEISWPAGGTP